MSNQVKPYSNINLAVISNNLAKASYYLSLTEHRLIKSFLKRVDNYFDKELEALATLTVQDYANDWGLLTTDARKEVKSAIDTLFNKKITLLKEDGVSYVDTRWLSEKGYDRETDAVMITWSQRVLNHISLLKERFTKLDLKEMKDFSSTYTFRIYELIICSVGENSYKNPKFPVEDLMNILDVPDSYRNYMTFKLKVLKPVIAELRSKTGKFSGIELVEHKKQGSKKIMEVEFAKCGVGNRYKKD